jgi:trehalose-phosphatase
VPDAAVPFPLPHGMLSEIASARGILLCLDYDGTLSEIAPDAANARPVKGIRESIERIAGASGHAKVAIVSGRRIEEVKRLLGIDSGILFSGVHGLEFTDADGKAKFVPEVAECLPELARVKQWLLGEAPDSRGFRIEDKVAAVGLHYRNADPSEAAALCARFSKFVAAAAPGLKLVQLKMLLEAMPRCASKARAVELLKSRKPRAFATFYFGDDSTDEDAFAVLGDDDVGVLIGAPRATRAAYRLPDPAALTVELSQLAQTLAGTGKMR